MDTYFDHTNVILPSPVFKVGDKDSIPCVVSVDVSKSEIEVCKIKFPLRVVDGKVETDRMKFSAIHPIYAGAPLPCMFLCFP